jgi:hypothetical protein
MRSSITHPLLSAWVKNVYSLCVEGVVNSGRLSPIYQLPLTHYPSLGAQPTSFTQVVDTFPPSLYTPKILQLTDTYSHLYTLSTPPTIKKNKKK